MAGIWFVVQGRKYGGKWRRWKETWQEMSGRRKGVSSAEGSYSSIRPKISSSSSSMRPRLRELE